MIKTLKVKSILAALLACLTAALPLSGCAGQAQSAWTPLVDKTITIALLGDEENFNADKGFLPGIQMAVEQIQEDSGVTVQLVTYDDQGDYNTGVSYANKVAGDPTVAAAISVQDFEIIDTVASIFNEAKKPLIVTDGCYDETSAKGNDYLITDFISADKMGRMLGEYAKVKGLKSVISSHTDTQFEKDEIKGFQAAVKSSDTRLADLDVGPFTKDEFDEMYNRWVDLGADCVYISMYSYSMGGEIIKMLREKNADVTILTDYSIDNETSLSTLGQYIEGTVIVPLYPITQSDALKSFDAQFQESNGFAVTRLASQSYDVIEMLAHYIIPGTSSSKDLMDKLKSAEGYTGVSGVIKFDSEGRLIVTQNQYLICEGGKFVNLEN